MRLAATLLATTLFCTALYADGIGLVIEKAGYKARSGQAIPGAPQGTWTIHGKAVNSGGEQQPFSVSGLQVRILEKNGEESWTQVPSAQRYAIDREDGLLDTLPIEPGKSHAFEIRVNELTRGLEPDKEYLIVVFRDEDGMAAIPYRKPKSDSE